MSITRRMRVAVVAMSVVGGLVGCGFINSNSEGITMDETLTRPAAQQQIVEYLTDTLRELPVDASLSRRSDVDPTSVQSPGTAVPCTNGNADPDIPVTYAVNYYVVGLPAGRKGTIVDTIVDAWEQKGWQTEKKSEDPPMYVAHLPNDYTLVIKGEYALSLSGSSPCFPPPPSGDEPDAPETIAHL